MLVFESASALKHRQPVVLFGEGLLGAAVAAELRLRGFRGRRIPIAWGADSGRLARQLKKVSQLDSLQGRDHLIVLWCAGAAGFGSSQDECELELADFRTVLEWTAECAGSAATGFGMLSSAGGLYEGQRLVSSRSVPAPRRPYGELKLREEDLAKQHLPVSVATRVYRLSTVFGEAPRPARQGLIAVLLENARLGRTTLISGELTTLRDFVWSGDIAQWIVRESLAGGWSDAAVEFLVAGKPTSIHEVLHVLEPLARGPVRVQFVPDVSNPEHITFSPGVYPSGWSPTDLATAVVRLGCRRTTRR